MVFFFGILLLPCVHVVAFKVFFLSRLTLWNRAQRFDVVRNAFARLSQLVEQRFQLDAFFRIGWSGGDWSVVLAVIFLVVTKMARVVVRLRHPAYFRCSIGGGKCVLNDDFVGNILGRQLRARANVGERQVREIGQTSITCRYIDVLCAMSYEIMFQTCT